MAYFKINGSDFSSMVSGLKVGYETLVSENSGRNANGDTVIDIINHKIKLQLTFRHTTNTEMDRLLKAIQNYVVEVSYLDPRTQTTKTIRTYTGIPEPEYLTISDKTIFKPMSLSFIQL